MTTTKLLKTIFIFSLTILSLTSIAFAANEAPIPPPAETQAGSQQACDRGQKVQAKIAQFSSQKKADVLAYNQVIDKIQKLIDKRVKEGYTTSRLKDFLQKINMRVAQYSSDFTAYNTALKKIQAVACEGSDEKWKEGIQKSRETLKKLHQDVEELKKYYYEIVRPELLNPTKLGEIPPTPPTPATQNPSAQTTQGTQAAQ